MHDDMYLVAQVDKLSVNPVNSTGIFGSSHVSAIERCPGVLYRCTMCVYPKIVGIMVIFNINIAPNSDRKLIVYSSNIPKTLNIKCTCQH